MSHLLDKRIIMQKNYILFGFICAFIIQVKAQDIHFSQYTEIPATINPALAGVNYDTRVIGNYRTQWGSVGKAYNTYGVSFEQAIKHKKLKGNYFAVSANIYRDLAGDAKMGMLNPNLGFTYVQKINKQMKLSAGLQGGFVYRTIDITKLRWDNQFNGYEYDPNRPSGEATPRSAISSYDLGGGVNYSYAASEKFISAKDGNKFNVGASAFHYEIPKNSFFTSSEKLYTRYCAYMNADINIPGTKNAVMPSFIYMRQGKSTEFVVGALYKFILKDQSMYTDKVKPSAFAIGVQYRYKDAIIPCMLMQYDKYAFGFAYDINVSALTPASKRFGAMEVMLRYNMSPGYGRNLGRGDQKASY
ncbi:MAG: PorP/SprF family type IX secretion system membrane protein [Bacteroidia bacterium]